MRKLLSALFVSTSLLIIAQPRGKVAKMAPTFAPGYYVTAKGDTVKGEIQNNQENEGDYYKTLIFRTKARPKPASINTKKARFYGFGDKHFVAVSNGSGEVYMEYLAKGRLNFLVFKYPDTYGGQDIISADYFIQDTKADEENKELRELKKLNQKFYKKEMKDYMKQQPMIWEDLDKFTFKEAAIANSVREFNRFYESSGETEEE